MLQSILGLIPLELDPAAVGAPFGHDRLLVLLSILAAIGPVYAHLELAARARARRGGAGLAATMAAGAMLGFAAWASHIIGLIALETPLLRGFDGALTMLSAFISIGVACAAYVVAGLRPRLWRYLAAGAVMGLGAGLMHYVGLWGMQLDADMRFRAHWVGPIGIVSIFASIAAFTLAHVLGSSWMRALTSLPIAFCIAGLHYADMAAMLLAPQPSFLPPAQLSDPLPFAVTILVGVLAVVGAALATLWLTRDGPDASAAPAGVGEPPPSHVVVLPASIARRRNAES